MSCKLSETTTFYTSLIVREDNMSLVGFSTEDELKVFRLLTTVSGIGAKVAIAALSGIHYLELTRMIILGDYDGLTRAPGVGKKTAQRIVLELRDKFSKTLSALPDAGGFVMPAGTGVVSDAIEAMIALGYRRVDVEKIIARMDSRDMTVEDIIRQALGLMAVQL
jgi:Holliday junction DNA helicase RuvA